MTEQRRLLIMGLLYQSDMHGYMLNAHLGMTMPISLKKPTAYNMLESLEREGLVEGSQESTGDRKRKVYSLTGTGRKAYLENLRKYVSRFIPGEYPGMVSLSFLDDLPREEARTALELRITKINDFLEELAAHSPEEDAIHQGSGELALAFMKDVVELEHKYIQQILSHMEET
jgi:DNA-binding PadR family transcriptional regulator